MSTLNRFKRAVHKYGLPSLALMSSRKLWRRLFFNSHYLFKLDGLDPGFTRTEGLSIKAYHQMAEVPPEAIQQIIREGGEDSLEVMKREFGASGVLHLGFMDEDLVAYVWSRYGKYIKRWYVPLSGEDLIIFSTETFPRWRGKRVSPSIIYQVLTSSMRHNVYADCKRWNKPSIRQFEKLGFKIIGVAKPLGK